MGKSKRKSSNKVKKFSPIGTSRDDVTDDEFIADSTNPLPLMNGLDSLDSSIRQGTCVALASLFGNNSLISSKDRIRTVQQLINKGITKKLIPRVVDDSKLVRLHAIGALRNMSVVGGFDICDTITSQDIITPLVSVLHEIILADISGLKAQDLDYQLMEQSVSLLTNLCESSSDAVIHLNSSGIIPKLVLLLNESMKVKPLKLEVSKLILVITDNNPELSCQLCQNLDCVDAIKSSLQSTCTSIIVKLNCSGVALNTGLMDIDSQIFDLVISTLKTALHYNQNSAMNLALEASQFWEDSENDLVDIQYSENKEAQDEVDETNKKIKRAKANRSIWEQSALILKLGLEITAMLFTRDDIDDADLWDTDDESKMGDFENDNDQYINSEELPIRVQKALTSGLKEQVEGLLKALTIIPENMCSSIINSFILLRTRACSCLTNCLQVLPNEAFGNLPDSFSLIFNLHHSWKEESNHSSFQTVDEGINDFEASITSTEFTLLRKATESGRVLMPTGKDVHLIIETALTSKSIEARSNCMGIIGCIGKSDHSTSENEILGECLRKGLSDVSLQVISECVNAIFDLYGEEKFDTIYNKLNFNEALECLNTNIKHRIRAEGKGLDREMLAHIKETRMNLIRFIKYKRQ